MSLNNGFDKATEEQEPPAWDTLRSLCKTNLKHFNSHQDEAGMRIKGALLVLIDTLENIRSTYAEISRIAPLFDFDENTPGNGYRSFLFLVDKCIIHSTLVCQELDYQKNSMLFRKSYHMREIEAYSQLLASLCTCLQHIKTLYSWQEANEDERSLFHDNHTAQELLNQAENINQYCFYGRCLGFQFCDSMKIVLKVVSVGMASFSELFYANGTLFGRCSNSLQYLLDPEARARRIVTISQHADISFCQAFWHLNESDLILSLPQIVMPALAINQLISIPPEEMEFPTLSGLTIKIPIPSSHIGKKPIHVRLLSSKRRIGMIGSGSVKGLLADQCDALLIHCHGGGFVAQSSRSHEAYMRTWTQELDVPILSIDYSLAPEAPYPRAVEEVLYAYVWALKHADSLLGSTAKRVILVGDSAGANLNLVTTIRCLELNIRLPDGIFMAYTPVLVDVIPSPARLLCLSDPILPFGFMMRCLKAYAAMDPKQEQWENESVDELVEIDKLDTESFAEVSESDLIALALSPTGDNDQNNLKLASLPSDSTLNSVSLTDVDVIEGTENSLEEAKSQEYVKRFLDIYRNSRFGSTVPIFNRAKSSESNVINDTKSWSFFNWNSNKDNKIKIPRHLEMKGGKDISEEFTFTVPKDVYLSPYRASDSLLKRFPPIKILSLDLDPCLDDCVMFARKLKSMGKSVTLDILPGLPHGFLNFSVVSKEAYEGSLVCVKRIRELLETLPQVCSNLMEFSCCF
ncbi:PREDICTED: hormone-sensitive lipase [Ceratosolen solmsi marchali]|uniref:Hormone-sensitive lipase n=1 Tax=Ceratosolen solmsi marchali TaxID=326594 RepID=A0AAJ6YM79_9HYME|nr:PREDICTED: hormone-sensitive lipase [Ceratosolen solmsi marchali]